MVQNENKSKVKGLKGNDLFIALSKKGKTCTVYCLRLKGKLLSGFKIIYSQNTQSTSIKLSMVHINVVRYYCTPYVNKSYFCNTSGYMHITL